MITVDRITTHASIADAFTCARDVTRWPQWLSHYRWVRFVGTTAGGTPLVEMAAWRPFGPLRWPTWWVSEMMVEPEVPRIRYRHVEGITRGMDVAWEFRQSGELLEIVITHRWDGPRWPLIGRLAASLVIGPIFVRGIANRTLRGIARAAAARPGDSP